jgi:hypothetical protein
LAFGISRRNKFYLQEKTPFFHHVLIFDFYQTYFLQTLLFVVYLLTYCMLGVYKRRNKIGIMSSIILQKNVISNAGGWPNSP